MKRILAIALLLSLGIATANAQSKEAKSAVRKANKLYEKEHYDDAATQYHKGLQADSTYYKLHYNLGNSLYRQKNYSEAATHFEAALQNPTMTDSEKSKAWQNLGNCHLKAGLDNRENGMEEFQKAVNSYKQSLKADPKNEDARYNLSYAKKLLAQAQQQQQNQQNQQQNQQNQQNQDQNKQNQDNKNQDKQNDQNKDKNHNQNKDQNKDNNQNGEQKDRQDQNEKEMKKQDAERLLDAVRNNEKNTLKGKKKEATAVRGVKIEKDW